MADYRETTRVVEEKRWRRAHQVVLENPLGGQNRSVTFSEEDVTDGEGDPLKAPAGSVSVLFNPADTFPLINPQTGQRTGATISHLEVYVIMHSLYIHLAAQRDAAQ